MNITPAPAVLPADFYVYAHIRANTGSIFYIGKGQRRRAWATSGRSILWRRIARKNGVKVQILAEGLQEWYAHELECDLIALHGRRDMSLGPLVNLTDGGDGTSGWIPSEETAQKISRSNLGRKLTDQQRRSISARQSGVPRGAYSDARRRAISASKIGKKATASARASISAAQRSKIRPVECIEARITFFTCRDAASWLREQGFKLAARASISRAANGGIKAHKYSWAWANKKPAEAGLFASS